MLFSLILCTWVFLGVPDLRESGTYHGSGCTRVGLPVTEKQPFSSFWRTHRGPELTDLGPKGEAVQRSKAKKVKLTDVSIPRLAPGTYKADIRGLTLKVYSGGTRSWRVRGKLRGIDKLKTLGSFEGLSIHEVEEQALFYRRQWAKAIDPDSTIRESETFSDVAARYLESRSVTDKSGSWQSLVESTMATSRRSSASSAAGAWSVPSERSRLTCLPWVADHALAGDGYRRQSHRCLEVAR